MYVHDERLGAVTGRIKGRTSVAADGTTPIIFFNRLLKYRRHEGWRMRRRGGGCIVACERAVTREMLYGKNYKSRTLCLLFLKYFVYRKIYFFILFISKFLNYCFELKNIFHKFYWLINK